MGWLNDFILTLHTDFNIPYVSDVIHERIDKHHNLEANPKPLLQPLLQPINTRELKRCWLTRHLKWHRWMCTLPRHSNTWYRSLLCIIFTLLYRLYSFLLLIKKIKKQTAFSFHELRTAFNSATYRVYHLRLSPSGISGKIFRILVFSCLSGAPTCSVSYDATSST